MAVVVCFGTPLPSLPSPPLPLLSLILLLLLLLLLSCVVRRRKAHKNGVAVGRVVTCASFSGDGAVASAALLVGLLITGDANDVVGSGVGEDGEDRGEGIHLKVRRLGGWVRRGVISGEGTRRKEGTGTA
ncbi:hypothetical protein DFP72DRAFT_856029 [Ephemerocybe angulata]|uniref:Uncharacterized protein n=1 Tax=Ephemerocybe angulata TaxID=980116 RepID=A0A8H6LWW8_9AGAR|nr:hypothetical protein DFP72DRAFT_856029 [Tulosesus angulatus]